jgi:uncharacterized protein
MTMIEKKKRGFACLSPEKRAEIAAKGGRAVKPQNRSFSRNRLLAAAAGHKGGKAVSPAKRSFSADKELAARAGRKGGKA